MTVGSQALTAVLGTALVLVSDGAAFSASESYTRLIEGFTAGGFIYISVGGVLADMSSDVDYAATERQTACMALGIALSASVHSGDGCSH